jgi:tetratricopeptide (TPR) repeat protein
MRLRFVLAPLVAALVGMVAIWKIVPFVAGRPDSRALAAARQEMSAGRLGAAQARLSALVARRPAWDEAVYELGVCEQARGRSEAAIAAFTRVSRDSAWAGWSDVRRSRLEMNRGHLAESERLLAQAAALPGGHVAEARWGMVLLLRLEGRFDEARRWLQEGFDAMTSPVATLRRLYKLDVDPFPLEGARRTLERAGDLAPEDDRVWLGRAHLALRTGDFSQSASWLARCLKRRPDDPVVWRMKLEWALAADRPDEVERALPHLPAALEREDRVPALRAWLAARRADLEMERRSLRELVERNPADGAALDRLAALEYRAGRTGEAARLRDTKNTIERDRNDYIRLLARAAPEDHAAELARLARRLGRRFDASRWAALAGDGPARGTDQSRTVSTAKAIHTGAPPVTLADLVLELRTTPATGIDQQPSHGKPLPTVPRFEEDAESAGLRFVHENGAKPGRLIPPVTSSGGIGLIDYDQDGWLDVYLVQGGAFPPEPGSSLPGDRLFRNRGDGTFEDATEPSGIGAMAAGYGHGVAVGDYDGDGYPDLFITRWRSYALYRNRGNGTFEDATRKAGLAGDRDWPTSAAFADLDADGDLDLYVCHYLKWDEHETRSCSDPSDPTIYRCLPLDFEALPDHLFRNDDGRFVDVTREAGIVDKNGRGLGVLAADLDGDGRTDLFVANDMTANYLFRNLGSSRFEEIGHASGIAGNASGLYQAGMGVACTDLDGDGRLDLAVTNFYNESTTYFRNLGHGFFTDETSAVGLAVPSRYMLGFGIGFLDANNDGSPDLITANGHVHDGRPQFPWKMPVQLMMGDGHGRLVDVSNRAGAPFETLRMGRALATGDLDNDGRADVLVLSQNESVAYFHNRTEGGHFLMLQLQGTTSNRDGVGTIVTIDCGGRRRIAPKLGGGSYQSACDPRISFGLGSSRRVESVEVRWPSGRVDRLGKLAADRGYLLKEGDSTPHPLPGWNPAVTPPSREKTSGATEPGASTKKMTGSRRTREN